MDMAVVFLFYGSILFCLVASTMKIVGFVTTPLHLKWGYYEGSSVYESPEWWTRPHITFFDKFKPVILDILFLRSYYERNRKFWFCLYVFHLGLYLLILWHGWLFLASMVVDPKTASSVGLIWGHIATALAFFGSLGILVQRIADKELSLYYAPIHYIKWFVMLITLAGGFYAVHVYFEASMLATLEYVRTQVTFGDLSHKLHPPPATAAHVLFGAIWLIYLPFSHVLRLFFRYYHALRFDEVPNVRGGPIESRIKELLGKRVDWSASHIQSGKTWAEVATQLPEEKKKEAPK
jgi:nitrate reductase gamma subunit